MVITDPKIPGCRVQGRRGPAMCCDGPEGGLPVSSAELAVERTQCQLWQTAGKCLSAGRCLPAPPVAPASPPHEGSCAQYSQAHRSGGSPCSADSPSWPVRASPCWSLGSVTASARPSRTPAPSRLPPGCAHLPQQRPHLHTHPHKVTRTFYFTFFIVLKTMRNYLVYFFTGFFSSPPHPLLKMESSVHT